MAEEAERKKRSKYVHFESSHFFVPVAVETHGMFCPEARFFIHDLGCRIMVTTWEPLSLHHLRQRISVAVQHGNAAAIMGSTGDTDLQLDTLSPIVG